MSTCSLTVMLEKVADLAIISYSVVCTGGENFVIKNDKGAQYLALDALQLDYN